MTSSCLYASQVGLYLTTFFAFCCCCCFLWQLPQNHVRHELPVRVSVLKIKTYEMPVLVLSDEPCGIKNKRTKKKKKKIMSSVAHFRRLTLHIKYNIVWQESHSNAISCRFTSLDLIPFLSTQGRQSPWRWQPQLLLSTLSGFSAPVPMTVMCLCVALAALCPSYRGNAHKVRLPCK